MSTPLLYPHQKEAYQALKETAEVFFAGDWQELTLRPRFSRFLAGPTGTGKSHVVRQLAEELRLPLLDLAASNWIPLGCAQRGARSTWSDIWEFLRRHPRGIIFLDEVDKLMGDSSTWIQFIRVEAFYLLDQRIPDPVILQASEAAQDETELALAVLARERMDDSFMVVGAGAFQDLIEKRPKCLTGFHSAPPNSAWEINQNDMATIIPREIANRFASPVLNLPRLQEKDYQALLAAILPRLPSRLAPHFRKIGEQTLSDALATQMGCRWIEEILLQALICQQSSADFSDQTISSSEHNPRF